MKHLIAKATATMTGDIRVFIAIACFASVFVSRCALGDDWPTYMHDNRRSGVTGETVTLSELDPGWVIHLKGARAWQSRSGSLVVGT